MHLNIETSIAPRPTPFETISKNLVMDLRMIEHTDGGPMARLQAAAHIVGAAEYLRVRSGSAKAVAVLEGILIAMTEKE